MAKKRAKIRGTMLTMVVILLTWGNAYAPPPTPAAINAAILDGLQYLVATQNANGSWGDNDIELRPEFPAATDDGDVGITALCVWAFLSHGVGEGDPLPFGPALDDGIAYLLSHVRVVDGAITNDRFPDYQTAMAIIALYATHNLAYAPIIGNARTFLKSAQIIQANHPAIPPMLLLAMPTYGGWGYNLQSSFGWPIPPVSKPDIMLSDGEEDVGEVPYDGPFWESRDFWVDNDEDGVADVLEPGKTNKLYVRVFNRGDEPAANVSVTMYASSFDLGLRLPTDHAIGTVELGTIESLAIGVGYVEWDVPEGTSHYCIGGIVQADGDPPSSDERIRMDNNRALQNVVSIGIPDEEPFSVPFAISNPTDAAITVDVDIMIHQDADDEGKEGEKLEEKPSNWDIQITGGAITDVSLPPGARETRTLTITPRGAHEGEEIDFSLLQRQQGGPQIYGGLTVFASVSPTLVYWPWMKPFLWADMSNTQWVVMALSLTESNFLTTPWDDAAIVFINRCQDPPPGTGAGRGFIYTTVPTPGPNIPYGSMSYAGLWSNALLPVVRAPIHYFAARNWAGHNYSVTQNPGWGQGAYYYYAVTMAKALQLSNMPWIVEPGPLFHNWYLELSGELLLRQNGAGYWENPDPMLGEFNRHLCTAYSLLVLESRAPLPLHCRLLVTLIADGVDLRIRDFEGRLLSAEAQEIPGGVFSTTTEGQQAELESLDPDTYRIVLKNTSGTSTPFRLLIQTFCDSEGGATGKICGDNPLFEREFEGTIEAEETLASSVNLSNIAGAMTVLAEKPAPMPAIRVTPEQLSAAPITLQEAPASFTLSVEGADAAHWVTLFGQSDDLLTVLGDEETVNQAFQFDVNGFDLESGAPQQVHLNVVMPPAVPTGTYKAYVLVASYDAATVRIPMELKVLQVVEVETQDAAPIPERFVLHPCVPNPFNPSTTVRYQLAQSGEVRLAIYDVLGQKVRALVSGIQPAGHYSVRWDGRNEAGRPVSSGVYLFKLEAGAFSEARKALLLR